MLYTKIYPLVGNSGVFNRDYHSNEIVRIFAERTGGQPVCWYAPAFVDLSLIHISIKLAVALSTYLVGWILDWGGYAGTEDIQAESTVQFIYMANGILPIVFGIIGIVMILPYDLTHEKMGEIKEELTKQRGLIRE